MDKTTEIKEEVTGFGERLNKHLDAAVLKLDDRAMVIEDEEHPIIDIYQIGDGWVKFKSKKTKKTWLVESSVFADSAAKRLGQSLDSNDKTKVKSEIERIASKRESQEQDGKLRLNACIQAIATGVDPDKDKVSSMLKEVWTHLEDSKWSSAIEYKIADQFSSKDVYQSLTRPFKQDGTQCEPSEFVVISSPFKSCWYTDGEYVAGSSDQIWHRAIDPIAWFGKLVEEKPTTLESYDSKEVALEPPTKEIEEATLREDEAFGYAI